MEIVSLWMTSFSLTVKSPISHQVNEIPLKCSIESADWVYKVYIFWHFLFLFSDLPSFSCTFEDGLCLWVQGAKDELDWLSRSDPTDTPNTGPAGDHTTGKGCQCTKLFPFPQSSNFTQISERPRKLITLSSHNCWWLFFYSLFSHWKICHNDSKSQSNLKVTNNQNDKITPVRPE